MTIPRYREIPITAIKQKQHLPSVSIHKKKHMVMQEISGTTHTKIANETQRPQTPQTIQKITTRIQRQAEHTKVTKSGWTFWVQTGDDWRTWIVSGGPHQSEIPRH